MRKIFFTVFFLILFVLFLASSVLADTHEVTNCTQTNVQNAINASTAGDTVYLNCSGGTWSSGVTISAGITIRGNGVGSTTIIGNTSGSLFTIQNGGTRFEMYGMTITGSSGTPGIAINGNFDEFIMRNITFTNFAVAWAIEIGFQDGWNMAYYGTTINPKKHLFYNITYTNNARYNFLKMWGRGYNAWREDDGYGTNNFIFIEDSVFSWSSTPDGGMQGVTDTESAGRFVFRHNTVTNGSIFTHDLGSTPNCRGNRLMEAYGNTFTCGGTGSGYCNGSPYAWGALGNRGGTGIFYNNTIIGYAVPTSMEIQRLFAAGFIGELCHQDAAFKVCSTFLNHCTGDPNENCYNDGTPGCTSGSCSTNYRCSTSADCPSGSDCIVVDGSDAYGWPCRDQIGRGKDAATTGIQASSPLYWWKNGTDSTCATGGTCTNLISFTGITNYAIENRDFCNHSPVTSPNPYNAGTCNSITLNYTPYTYPHLLRGSSVPQTCGNNTREGTEVCDGTDLAGQTCVSRGFSGGTLACNSQCSGFVTTACTSSQRFLPEQIVQAESGTLNGMQTGISGSDTYVYTNLDNTGSVSFTFDIQNPGQYKMEARVNNNNDGGQNSFYVGLDSEAAQGNVYYTYNLFPLQTGFYWDNVSRWGNGQIGDPPISEFNPMIWDLSASLHTFTFYGRESNTWLDQIILKRVTADTMPPAAPSGLAVI